MAYRLATFSTSRCVPSQSRLGDLVALQVATKQGSQQSNQQTSNPVGMQLSLPPVSFLIPTPKASKPAAVDGDLLPTRGSFRGFREGAVRTLMSRFLPTANRAVSSS